MNLVTLIRAFTAPADLNARVSLPDIPTYAHPRVAEAWKTWQGGREKQTDARHKLRVYLENARREGHHDASERAAMEKAAADADAQQLKSWAAFVGLFADPEVAAAHRAEHAAAVRRLREAIAAVEEAAATYASKSALVQAHSGDLFTRADRVPGLLALNAALIGDGLATTVGLEYALTQLPADPA